MANSGIAYGTVTASRVGRDGPPEPVVIFCFQSFVACLDFQQAIISATRGPENLTLIASGVASQK